MSAVLCLQPWSQSWDSSSVGSTEQDPVLGFCWGVSFPGVILSREVNFYKRAASGLKVILASFGRVQCVGV